MRQIILTILFLSSFSTFSQNFKPQNNHYKHVIKFTPTAKLLSNKLLFNYEYAVSGLVSIETQFGYLQGEKDSDHDPFSKRNVLFNFNFRSRIYTGTVFKTGVKYYMVNKKYFINPMVSYMDLEHDLMNVQISGKLSSYTTNDDEYQAHSEEVYTYGFQVNIGKYYNWDNVVVELFGGVGFRKQQTYYRVHEIVKGDSNIIGDFLRHEKRNAIYPTFDIGVRIGLGFQKLESIY